jgi:hypothetical protein
VHVLSSHRNNMISKPFFGSVCDLNPVNCSPSACCIEIVHM